MTQTPNFPAVDHAAGAAIQMSDLVVNYGTKTAVTGLTLTVPTGSVFGFLGPNGAGKTTTIKALLGFRRPDGGHAEVLGFDVVRQSEQVRARVGYVSEVGGLYDGLNVDQLERFFQQTARRWQPATFERFRARAGAARRSRIRHLSGGVKMQLAFALAMGGDPELLILDEPTAGLDPLARRALLGSLITEVAALGKTVFFSGHHLAEVESVADSVGILKDGRLVLSGNLDDLKQRHRALRLSYDAAPTAQTLAALHRLPGVTALEQDGRTLRLSVQGDVQAMMQQIRLQDDAPGNLEPLDQNLEDLFHSLMREDAP